MKNTISEISLESFAKFELKSVEKIPFNTTIKKFPKNTDLITKGQIEKNIYFIISGIVEVSVLDEEGDEKILSFSFPGEFTGSLSSFITQKPTEYRITCITDSVLEIIPRDALFKAKENSVIANRIYVYFLEYAYLLRLNKQKDLLTKSALERYLELIKNEPEVFKQLTIKRLQNI